MTDIRDLEPRFALAERLADAAAAVILPHFRSGRMASESKLAGGYDPVTVADRAAEAAMRELIEAEFPDDGILGEELGTKQGRSGLTWVLDPIDGTRGFVSGTPTWGVLIGLADSRGPVFGVIDQPYTGERFIGGPGGASFVRAGKRTRIVCAPAANLESAILFSTFPEVGTPGERAGFQAVSSRVKLTRYGMDCYAYALVAAGQIDLVIEAGLHPYDVHAPIAVIHAAGGIVTDWSGGPAHDGGRVLAAASRELHAAALALLADAASD